MIKLLGTTIGKTAQRILQLFNNKGQSLPGLIVEKLWPSYLPGMLKQLPEGIVFVMGTNGKTTTTKIVAELLRTQGKRVITNGTGSNLTRGIISGVLQHAKWDGTLPFDIAVFEVDEAYAKKLLAHVKPRWVLALNVSRDQLDRFGEVDAVARLLGDTMAAAEEGVVINADDPYLSAIGAKLSSKHRMSVEYFGAHNALHRHFPHDKMIASVGSSLAHTYRRRERRTQPRVQLTNFHKQGVTYTVDGQTYQARLQLVDPHNYLNAAAALALALQLLPDTPVIKHLESLAEITPAYGRGEIFRLGDGGTVQLTLVKNPASFFQALSSYRAAGCDIMIAINDNYADSRDVSWLWDVDFLPLKGRCRIITSGQRAADMALRLQYDDISTDSIPDIDRALQAFCRRSRRKVIFATYTAMLYLYERLKKQAAEIVPSQSTRLSTKQGFQQPSHGGTR